MARARPGRIPGGSLTAALTVAACAATVLILTAQRQGEGPALSRPSVGRSPDVLVQQGRFPAEEWFVRDLYARLTRYESAGRQFRAGVSGERPNPADALQVRIGEMQSGVGPPARPADPPAEDVLNLRRELLCHQDDPCHVLYDLSWGPSLTPAAAPEALSQRYTEYRISVRYMRQVRTYRAVVLFYDRPDGTTVPQILDPYIPDLDLFASERAPFAKSPWHSYVRTRRYAAVVNEAAQWRGDLARWPKHPPIGYVLGDRVTPEDEMLVAMSFEPCGGQTELSVTVDSNELRPAGTGGTVSTTVRVHGTPGTAVSLQLNGTPNSGGHIDAQHVGNRHVGTVAPTNGVIGGNGLFAATYSASHIAGPVRIVAQGGGAAAVALVQVGVQGLEELGAGSGYVLTGFDCCPEHPQGTNHWGTPTANLALQRIASYYPGIYPGAANLWYNDQSLPLGGKFDLAKNWSNTGSHSEHREGINTDVRMSDVPASRHPTLENVFRLCGSPGFLPEPGLNHWHLRQTGPVCPTPVAHRAVFVSQSVPTSMNAGQSYAVSVTMRNIGTATWTAGEGLKIGSQNPQDNQTWGLSRVVVPSNVPFFEEVTFNFTVTAPSSAGAYNFQWLMVKEWVEWFGDLSPNVAVAVGGGGGPGPSGMESDSAIRGCAGWWWWNPVYQPSANACYNYCAQNNADACEWFGNGDCYVEFGSGCYVQPGFPGWSAAVLNGTTAALNASVRPVPPMPSPNQTAQSRGPRKQP